MDNRTQFQKDMDECKTPLGARYRAKGDPLWFVLDRNEAKRLNATKPDEHDKGQTALAEARAQVELWRDIAMQAQDRISDLEHKLFVMELRCDCS